jgi:hypothetical protein
LSILNGVIIGPRGGVVLGAEYEPIPEADQQIAILVADLVPKEVPSVGLPFVALLDSILRKRKPRISQEQWAEEQCIGHTTLKDWKAAGGKPIRGKVSEGMAREIETAILQDAEKLGLRLAPSSA